MSEYEDDILEQQPPCDFEDDEWCDDAEEL